MALHHGERALQITEHLQPIDEDILSDRQNTLALMYQNLGRYAEAADLFEKSLAYTLKHFGKDHSDVAILQSNFALVYRDLG